MKEELTDDLEDDLASKPDPSSPNSNGLLVLLSYSV